MTHTTDRRFSRILDADDYADELTEATGYEHEAVFNPEIGFWIVQEVDDDYEDDDEQTWVDEEDEPEEDDEDEDEDDFVLPQPRYTGSFDAEGDGILTVVVDGKAVTFTSDHPRWGEIIDDVTHGRMPSDTPFEVLLENVPGVKVTDGVLTIDGYPVHSDLADTIRRYHREGRDTVGLSRFAEKLQDNPSEASRDSLFTWAGAKDMTINEEGYLIGFKAVTTDFRSKHVGPAIVDGEEYDPFTEDNGRQGVPNQIGSVVEMNRQEVDDDNSRGCSTGLHFGTWSYAKQFGGYDSVIMEVKVDPADVVSVPTDSGFQKVRCCRYEVLAIHDANGALARYEAAATRDQAEEVGNALAAQGVPPTFLERIMSKFRARNN